MRRRTHTGSIGAVLSSALMAVLVVLPASAGDGHIRRETTRPGRVVELGGALDPAGRFLGARGLAGAVDATAWRLTSDLSRGDAPRFARSTSVGPAGAADWSALGANGSNGALNANVNAIAVDGSNVYVGGAFTNAGGVAAADYVAKWNGSAWSALGSNAGNGAITGTVSAIAVSGTDVYVGGSFTNANGLATADYVAKWNGSAWSALGSSGSNGALGAAVYAMGLVGTDLYVGGAFINAAGIARADYLAKWANGAWSEVGSTGSAAALNGFVATIAVSGTDVYVGGAFTSAGGAANSGDIAKWNGNAWSGMHVTLNVIGVTALAVHGDDLYHAFMWDALGDVIAYVSHWDGSEWDIMGNPFVGPGVAFITSIAATNSDLYAGGLFFDADGGVEDNIARFDGVTWDELTPSGSGALNGAVGSLAASGDRLYVGGNFTNAAGIASADYLARFTEGGGPATRKPDGRIRVGSTGAYAGDNVYNLTGVGQKKTSSKPRGQTITFEVSIQNDGSGPDSFKAAATGGAASGYTVKYFDGATNITAAVVAGTYTTPSLAAGATRVITVKVKVKSSAAVGSKVTRLVTIRSVDDPSQRDAVKFIGKRA